jgi:hypothetical protein
MQSVLFVADNDEDPIASFNNVCVQIERIFGSGCAPSAPLAKVAKAGLQPAITVLMLPWTGVHGHLERLCLGADRSSDAVAASHVDTFMSLIVADRWGSESRFAKAWLRTNLAARCVRDPFVPLGHVFSDPRNAQLIPINHGSFHRILDEVRKF